MLKTNTLYLNSDAPDPATALVRSPSNISPKEMPAVVAGDTMRLNIVVLDSDGAISTYSGDSRYRVKAAIGSLTGTTYCISTNFYASASWGWTGSLNTATGSLTASFGSNETLNAYFEIELTSSGSLPDSGSRYTLVQTPITLRNQIIN